MTKSDLIDLLCETRKIPKGRAELLVNTIFESMVESLTGGERIEIRGFGSFEIRNYRAYAGRNPRTGSTVDVKPKRLPFFKVGKELKDRVNTPVARIRDKQARQEGKSFSTAPIPVSRDEGDEQPLRAPDLLGRLPSAQP